MQKNSPIKQRILQFIDTLSISKRDFYAKTGISRGTLESPTGITEDTVAKFIECFGEINPIWLLTGNGEMLYQKKANKSVDVDQGAILFQIIERKDAKIEELIRENCKLRVQVDFFKNKDTTHSKVQKYGNVAEP